MKYTDKLSLNKPDIDDYINISDINANMDIIDIEFGKLMEGNFNILNLLTDSDTLRGAINELKLALDNLGIDFEEFIGNVHKLRISEEGKFQFNNGVEWVDVDIDPKVIRDVQNVPLRVQLSSSEPSPETGRIYFNTVDNLFYIARNGQWYRLYVGGDEKLDRDPPTSPPVLDSKTDTTVTLVFNEDMEYRYQGGTWQQDSHFGGLQRNEQYEFEQRYKSDDVYKASPPSSALAVTTDKGSQSAPSAPTVSNIEFDRATVTGESNTEVRLNSGNWQNSPHTFTGLSEETIYTAYARRKETNTHNASPQSTGKQFTTPAEQKIYGVEIDQSNSNPNTRVVYTDDAVGFTPAKGNNGNFSWGSWEDIIKNEFGIRPCVLRNPQGTVNYYLQYDNYTKKADGSNSNLTGTDGDVMIEFANQLWWKFTKSGNKVKIQLSAKQFPGAVKHAFEIENGYNLVPFYALTLLQIIMVLMLKSTDTQTALGRGWVDSPTNPDYANTGGTNTKTFCYGETTGKLQMKFLGTEDFWGNRRWWVDGCFYDSNLNMLIGKSSFNDTGNGYTNKGQAMSSGSSGYISEIQGENDTGFIPKVFSGSATTHYCDYGYVYEGLLPYFGGAHSNGDYAGGFSLYSHTASTAYASIGGRLFYSKDGKIYFGAYLGATVSSKLRSVSNQVSENNKTIGAFRTLAKANN